MEIINPPLSRKLNSSIRKRQIIAAANGKQYQRNCRGYPKRYGAKSPLQFRFYHALSPFVNIRAAPGTHVPDAAQKYYSLEGIRAPVSICIGSTKFLDLRRYRHCRGRRSPRILYVHYSLVLHKKWSQGISIILCLIRDP